jgi:putative membrane protein
LRCTSQCRTLGALPAIAGLQESEREELVTDHNTGNAKVLVWTSVAAVALLVVSGVRPFDRLTWLLEVAPVLIALPVMWATRRRFPLTTLLYWAVLVHAAVLIYGGAYTYSRVPLGDMLQSMFELSRNPYDKIGHLLQGFVPALVAREILVRGAYVRGRAMLAFIIVCIVLAVSATYELIEWAFAMALGQGADEFLGLQGDEWDTQTDMLMALLGAIAALLSLTRLHDAQIAALARGD